MHLSRRSAVVLIALLVCIIVLLHPRALGSDAFSTPATASTPGEDLTDLYVFPSPTNANNVVFVLNLHPAIPAGQGPGVVFDPNVLFQIKIDNTGDLVEDLVLQARFTGTDPATQQALIAGPLKPSRTGTQAVFETPDTVKGMINTPFTLSNGVKVFAGAREDPFFFDLNQFYSLLPDRANPLGPTFDATNGVSLSTTPAQPNQLMANAWRASGQAQDFFKGRNVMSIVVEVPKSLLGSGKLNVWCTTSR